MASGEDPVGGQEEFLEDAGVLAPLSDSDTVVLFRDLETELERMIKQYHVLPGDMEKLFQVVQSMFEMMYQSQEANEDLEKQKNELEELWNAEKEKAKLAQRRKLELECRLEEEKLKTESEKGSLEKRVVDLETRIKHLTEHKSDVEQDLRKMRERHEREDQMRKDLVIQYKRQYDSLKRRPGRSKKFQGSLMSRQRSLPPVPRQPWDGSEEPSHAPSPRETLLQSTTSESAVSEQLTVAAGVRQPLSPGAVSLEEELKKTTSASGNGKRSLSTQTDPVSTVAETATVVSGSYEEPYYQDQLEMLSSSDEEGYEVGGAKVAPENTEGISLEEELMAVDPGLFAPARAELELLQHKKEAWESEREELAQEKEALRTEKEVVERQNAQLQLEIDQLKQSRKNLEMEVTEVKRERDEVLENYLDQPFDEYCITRKELYELLKRHQKTAIELEKQREEKERLQAQLDAKKSLFARFKSRMKQLFSQNPRQPSSSSTSSSDHRRSPTHSDRTMDRNSLSPAPFFSHSSPSPRPSSPLTRSLTPSLLTNFTVVKGWLVSVDEGEGGRVVVPAETLPIWMGQITLKGIETERIECAAVGHVYHSIGGVVPGQVTPTHHQAHVRRYNKPNALPWLQQLHTEVWVATSEAGTAFIEIVDVLAKPAKVRQTFILKPKTKHIVCMKAIPGTIDTTHDFTDFTTRTADTSWVEPNYSPQRSQLTASLGQGRPHSAPVGHRRRSSPIRISARGDPEGRDNGEGPLSRRLEFPLGGSVESARFSALSEPGLLMTETIDHLRARSSAIHQDMLVQGVIREVPVPNPDSGKPEPEAEPEPDLDLSSMSMEPTESPDRGPRAPHGRPARSKTQERVLAGRKGAGTDSPHVMWIITEDNRLCFHPVTHPSHIPLNSVRLRSRALCMEYIKDKVYVGHCNSEISVFCKDEFSGSWDIENPERITLPSSDPSEYYDVKCLVGVGDRLWVGTGPSIFFLDTETYTREGSIFMDSWRKRPEQMLAVGDCVVVATKGSALFVFDANSARLLRKFDVAPMTKLLEQSRMPSGLATPTDIKSLLKDEKNIYAGTSNGRIVAIPIEKLRDTSPAEDDINELTRDDTDGVFQQQSAISLHTHKDDRVKTLLYIQLPADKPPRKRDRTLHYGSLPNLMSSSQSALYRASMVTPLIKSLILSVGKGHMEYSVSAGADSVEESSAMRERNEAFQLLIWGHRNTLL